MKALRFGSAVSAVALATILAGCAAPTSRNGTALNTAKANVAYGLRAQMALESGDFSSAIDFAEKAVEASPQDATVRAVLANAYFGAGRFASAEAAYTDALSLAPNQPQVILKLALVQIAQGKNGQALALLDSARNMIEPADYGLALALAGQPAQAVEVLEPAARSSDADARVRQNLALAYALGGDWVAARTVAAQDLSPADVDARVQQWMALAKPARASDQVAALVGVSPAAVDPGQPFRLALSPTNPGVAVAAAEAQPPVQVAEAAQAPAPVQPAPVPAVAEASPAPAPTPTPAAQSNVAAISQAAAIAPEAPAAFAAMASNFAPKAKPAAAPKKPAPVRRASLPRASGQSKSVVQLGAYSSSERVSAAWAQLSKKYPALANYAPVRAKFDGPKGTVWRLSIQGFETQGDALASCKSLRSRGGNCFVRSNAGDAPVQFASR
ncbi:tetratricopeptide repeat protein [Sphingomonas sp. SM33]|uniref:Tetratricopeptide repeat protein n=1 Tax=Sphingomonas telluris TaxID=2907998 RepID=A0ABS9VKP5_9SPHN|nr:SPOR domain-containing protein [Sphingomonas telluris]MCH8615288.1 tetratricopeptide repeat protein [Sphingomonas telluris]